MIKFNLDQPQRTTLDSLGQMSKRDLKLFLHKYGKLGVELLKQATPKDSGLTASAWSYELKPRINRFTIYWTNDNIVLDIPIAALIQYGHATQSGGWVEGVDYINEALSPMLDLLANEIWRGIENA